MPLIPMRTTGRGKWVRGARRRPPQSPLLRARMATSLNKSGSDGLSWRKSSRCNTQNNCVEVALTDHGVAMRDSVAPHGGTLVFTREAWRDFVRFLRDDGFER